MESPTTPITCNFFENYGLDAASYNTHLAISSNPMQSPDDIHREICIRKCASVAPILKENWMELIFTVHFPSLICQEKLMHTYSLQQLTDILSSGDLLPEEREEIKKMRCKARNNKAAKSLRQKHKQQDKMLANDVTSLMRHKDDLIKERDQIRQEISQYKSLGVHSN